MVFFRETNGDYLAVDPRSSRNFLPFDVKHFECVAPSKPGSIKSVQKSQVTEEYLQTNCKKVAKKLVPEKWLDALMVSA